MKNKYTATEIVKKIYLYTGKELQNNDHLYMTAKLSDEIRVKLHEEIFYMRVITEKVNSQLKENSSYINFEDSNFHAAKSYSIMINRYTDYLFAPLRDMLRPVWNVYWNEGCNSFNSICTWLSKADEDNGAKVFEKLKSMNINS